MKKFLIMFVMLLGSVATMQAQSNTTFDFSCVTFTAAETPSDFVADEVVDLVDDGFSVTRYLPDGADPDTGYIDIPNTFAANIQLTPNGLSGDFDINSGRQTVVTIEREHDGAGDFNYFLISGYGLAPTFAPTRVLQADFDTALVNANAAVAVAEAQALLTNPPVDYTPYASTGFSETELELILLFDFELVSDGNFRAMIRGTEFIFSKPYTLEDTVEFAIGPETEDFVWDHPNVTAALEAIVLHFRPDYSGHLNLDN